MNPIFGFPEIVRFSWSSCSRILEESAVAVKWYDPVIEESTNSYKKRPAQILTSQKIVEKKERNYLSAYKCKIVIEL